MGTENLEDADGVAVISRILGIEQKPSARITDLEIQGVERELGVRLPPSYRTFLRAFGAKLPGRLGLLGLPRGQLSGDLVLRNYLDRTVRPHGFVKFLEADGPPHYYLATTFVNVEGECPVVMLDLYQEGRVVALSFLEFLERFCSERLHGRQLAGLAEQAKGYS